MLSWKQRHLATHKQKTIIPTQTRGTASLTYLPTPPLKSRHMDESRDTRTDKHTQTGAHRNTPTQTQKEIHMETQAPINTHPYRPTAAGQINLSGRERNLDVLNTYFVPDIAQEH